MAEVLPKTKSLAPRRQDAKEVLQGKQETATDDDHDFHPSFKKEPLCVLCGSARNPSARSALLRETVRLESMSYVAWGAFQIELSRRRRFLL